MWSTVYTILARRKRGYSPFWQFAYYEIRLVFCKLFQFINQLVACIITEHFYRNVYAILIMIRVFGTIVVIAFIIFRPGIGTRRRHFYNLDKD